MAQLAVVWGCLHSYQDACLRLCVSVCGEWRECDRRRAYCPRLHFGTHLKRDGLRPSPDRDRAPWPHVARFFQPRRPPIGRIAVIGPGEEKTIAPPAASWRGGCDFRPCAPPRIDVHDRRTSPTTRTEGTMRKILFCAAAAGLVAAIFSVGGASGQRLAVIDAASIKPPT